MLREEGAAEVVCLPIDEGLAAIGEGVDRAVLASGDGGVGPAAEAAGAAGVPLAVIPSGTANDFARRMRLPDDPREAARLAVRGEHRRRLDLARMGDHPFVNVAAAGMSVAAARRAAPLKRVLGPFAYFVGAGVTAVVGRPLRCAVDVDDRRVFQGRAWQVMVACSGSFGAGSVIDEADAGRRPAGRGGDRGGQPPAAGAVRQRPARGADHRPAGRAEHARRPGVAGPAGRRAS